LKSGIFKEGYLKRVESIWGCYALHSIYYRTVGFYSEDKATIHDSAIHVHGTCSTVAVIATFFGAGELQYVSQALQ
jgi:hypothetical protein|tara:strand:- start:368 stop:595 length:228 start_codon:yes stop_codon:yes gene_type:complete